MKEIKYISLIILALLTYNQLFAQQKKYCDKKASSISYSMNHPLHEWTGVNNEVTSIVLIDTTKKEIIQVAVSAKIAGFDSQNANRDSHMIEITEGLKYPVVTFESHTLKHSGNTITVSGKLSFHGVSKEISFAAVMNTDNKNKLEISGDFAVLMSDFNIEPPSLMGMATDDEIKISFKIFY